jgi:hypothetical protein
MGGTFSFEELPNVVSISISWELLRSSRNSEDDNSPNNCSVCIKPTSVTRFRNKEIRAVVTSMFPTSERLLDESKLSQPSSDGHLLNGREAVVLRINP